MQNVTKWKSTVLGLVALLIPVLVAVGWLSPEKAGPLGEQAPVLIEAIVGLIAAIFGFIGIFKMNDDSD